MTAPDVKAKDASAIQHVHATNEFTKEIKEIIKTKNGEQIKWEIPYNHTHKIAYQFIGKASQNEKNLGIATAFANTDMMFVESQVERLLEKYPDVTLDVTGHYIEGTQIMTSIDYLIITKDFTLPFTFHAQENQIPDFTNQAYVRAVVDAMMEEKKSAPTAPTNHSNHVFFREEKKKVVKQLDFSVAPQDSPATHSLAPHK